MSKIFGFLDFNMLDLCFWPNEIMEYGSCIVTFFLPKEEPKMALLHMVLFGMYYFKKVQS